MLQKNLLYNLKDVCIKPSCISYIKSRKECNIFYPDGNLPIFTAPMDAVIDIDNLHIWEKYNINTILPRTIDLKNRIFYCKIGKWIAVGLDEFEEYFIKKDVEYYNKSNELKVLIDVANGHMSHLYTMVQNAKKHFENSSTKLIVMIGNIANPNTYTQCINSGIDYARVGIGGGTCCTTSSQSGIHYPMASLLDEINIIKNNIGINIIKNGSTDVKFPKIIADGGISTYSDVIKALALGADYVMIGTTFASLFESASKLYTKNTNNLYECIENYRLETNSIYKLIEKSKDLYLDNYRYININNNDFKYNFEDNYISVKKDILRNSSNYPIIKKVYGMSTPEAQRKIDPNKQIKVTEGLARYINCNKTVYDWVFEFSAYLKSAMSYTNINDIKDFIGAPNCYIMSNNTVNSINKPIDNVISYDY